MIIVAEENLVLYLFYVAVFVLPSFHFPLMAVRLRWHRSLIFMEDSDTVISVTYERLSLACQLLGYSVVFDCWFDDCHALLCVVICKSIQLYTVGYESGPSRARKHSPELLTP